MSFSYTNSKNKTYFLHSRATNNGQTLYFFAKEAKDGVLDAVPAGYHVAETKTGLPVLKKDA
ncbi:MAG: hypothetical protein KDE56_16540 [Anaerolineales bacterium]|nr:hypothetical protein [Anaerolineales bacterium]